LSVFLDRRAAGTIAGSSRGTVTALINHSHHIFPEKFLLQIIYRESEKWQK